MRNKKCTKENYIYDMLSKFAGEENTGPQMIKKENVMFTRQNHGEQQQQIQQ